MVPIRAPLKDRIMHVLPDSLMISVAALVEWNMALHLAGVGLPTMPVSVFIWLASRSFVRLSPRAFVKITILVLILIIIRIVTLLSAVVLAFAGLVPKSSESAHPAFGFASKLARCGVICARIDLAVHPRKRWTFQTMYIAGGPDGK